VKRAVERSTLASPHSHRAAAGSPPAAFLLSLDMASSVQPGQHGPNRHGTKCANEPIQVPTVFDLALSRTVY
jgi:hypothetical protein